MTDRELLELAAKAAGIEKKLYNGDIFYVRARTDDSAKVLKSSIRWNPLTDDGDALRLAVKLNISIAANQPINSVEAWYENKGYFARERCNNDPYAATRRAIVCAAAEIGKSL